MKIKKTEKRILKDLSIFAYLSGAILFILSHWVRVQTQVGEQHHPSEFWIRMLHTSVTYVVGIAFGYLIAKHVIPSWKEKPRKHFPSGILNLTVITFLIISAISILYGGETSWNNVVIQSHAIVGLVCPLIIFFHIRKRKPSS